MLQEIDLGDETCYPPEDLEGLAREVASENDYVRMKYTRAAFLRTINTAIVFRDLFSEAIEGLCGVRDAKTIPEVRAALVAYLAAHEAKYGVLGEPEDMTGKWTPETRIIR